MKGLKSLLWNGRDDLLGLSAVAQQSQQQALSNENIRRNFAMSDAYVQKCNPDYSPPDGDDMSNPVFINAGIMGDNTVNELTRLLSQHENANPEVAGEADRGTPQATAGRDGAAATAAPAKPNRPVTQAAEGFIDGLIGRVPKWLRSLGTIAAIIGGFWGVQHFTKPRFAEVTEPLELEVVEQSTTIITGASDAQP